MYVLGILQRSMSRPQILTFLYPLVQSGHIHLASSQRRYVRKNSSTFARVISCNMDRLFIDALVQASSCREHTWTSFKQGSISKYPYIFHRARRRNAQQVPIHTRSLHTSPNSARPPAAHASFSREEYEQMLDYYFEPLEESLQPPDLGTLPPALPLPDNHDYKPMFEESGPPENSTTPEPAKHREEVVPAWMKAKANTREEWFAVKHLNGVLKDGGSSQELIWQSYSALPHPGVSYLPSRLRRLLFRRISVVERKSNETMLQYLSVVDDMKVANLPLTEAEWNSAIAFTGRCFASVSAQQVELALRSWKEMEYEAKIRSGNVTFNILFDIATKAGKFVLAEMLLKEMQARKLSVNRLARVGIIYYHGLRGDGNAVRRAYRSLVKAGEIVDTVVMNCVIASLIRAGEPSAADLVYERMKVMYASKTGSALPVHDWKAARDLGRILNRAARDLRHNPKRRQRIQDETCLAPNLRTYAIFIEHHVTDKGELLRIKTLLEEMLILRVPMHGMIFVKLFKGFATHGGVRYTSWTRAALESVWAALLSALDAGTPDVAVQKWMVVWVVRAFAKCSGHPRALEIWAALLARWKADGSTEAEQMDVLHVLKDSLQDPHPRDSSS